MTDKLSYPVSRFALGLLGAVALLGSVTSSQAWWDKEWTARKAFTIDTTAEGGAITDPIGNSVVLIRLHSGNFQFGLGKEDGSDIRFVSEDDKTVLPSHVEKYDGLMNEAFVWVKVPEVKPGAKNAFWLYYGNQGDTGSAQESKATYDDNDALVYHFNEQGSPARDSSGRGNNAETAGTASQGSMIGSGLRLLGKAITIPGGESFNWSDGGTLTWSAWIKPSNVAPKAVIFFRAEGGQSFEIGLDQGVPYVEVKNAGGTQRSSAGEPLSANVWKNLSVTAEGSTITLYVDGKEYSKLGAALPALTGPAYIGGTGPEGPIGFVGEVDELQIAQAVRPVGAIKLAAIGQSGSDASAKLLTAGEDETSEGGGGHSHVMEHLSLFGEISKSLTFDGWAVIVLCSIMAVIGWYVAVRKFFRLNVIKKGNDEFIKQWQTVANDLTLLDHSDAESVKSLGGKAGGKTQALMRQSPVYQIYHIGSEEIRHRITKAKDKPELTSRSIQAIRASLDGGLVREVQRLNGDLIFLTISIAGGPYLGLLGTVIGVMITFATIARTGEVEVNSIAPGIAGALLATVAGLVVAIPALFAYSYLAARIKDSVNTMQIFIDEFVSKMAEFYPPASE